MRESQTMRHALCSFRLFAPDCLLNHADYEEPDSKGSQTVRYANCVEAKLCEMTEVTC